jgi:hypothetical protein
MRSGLVGRKLLCSRIFVVEIVGREISLAHDDLSEKVDAVF